MDKTNFKISIFALFFVTLLLSLQFVVAQSAIDLGTAGDFVILAKSGISTTGTTSIVGNIGVSPAAATFITGFGLIADTSNTFSISSLITGKVYAADYTSPTPTKMTTAISDMEIAYTNAAGRTNPTATELGAGNIGGLTIAPGLYKWDTGVTIPTDVTLSGSSNDVWIFQIAQNLDIAPGKQIKLIGGAQAKNIFWQVAGQTTIGTTAVFNGNILDQTSIVLNTGAVLNGRALAQTAVTLDASSVSLSSSTNLPDEDQEEDECFTNWTCSDWSTCSNGEQMRNCNKEKSSCSVILEQPALSRSCTMAIDNSTNNNQEKQNQNQTTGNLGETKEEIMARINLRTGLNISLVEEGSLGSMLRARLSNGKYATIRVLPAEASIRAQEELNMKCEETNCTVELKEIKINNEARAVYEVKIEKKAKLFGFINIKEKIGVNIDVETGEVLSINRPWWSFLAREENK